MSDSTTPKELSILNAVVDDARITLMVTDEDGEAFTMRVPLMGYDEAERKYVDDNEVYEKAEEILASIHEDLTVENIEDMVDDEDITFTGYTDDEDNRASLKPIVRFVQATLASFDVQDYLDDKENAEQESTMIFDNSHRQSFDVRVTMDVDDKGDKSYRISQLVHKYTDDKGKKKKKGISLKYTSPQAKAFEDKLKDPEAFKDKGDKRAKMEEKVAQLVEKSRIKKIAEIEETFGFNIEELIENGDQLKLKVEFREIAGADNGWLAAEVISVENAE